MGNTVPSPYHAKAARVILPGGEIRQLTEPTITAELMLECSNFFLTDVKLIVLGKRFSPLGASDELQKGSTYILLPMKRASSVATAADMAAVFKKSSFRPIYGYKILCFPRSGCRVVDEGEQTMKSLPMGSSFQDTDGFLVSEYKVRLPMSRSRKPALETIKEESVKHKTIMRYFR